jgi:segregation and condensation protein A
LIRGIDQRGVIVARFLAILELYRQSAITFQQLEPLGELTLQWVAQDFGDEQLANLGDEWGGENTAHE